MNPHDNQITNWLLSAIDKNNIAKVESVLDKHCNINKYYQYEKHRNTYLIIQTPLHAAIKKDAFDIAKLLLEKGADPNIRINEYKHQSDTICHAIQYSSLEMLNLLIKHGAKIALDINRYFYIACNRNRIDMLDRLLEFGANINSIDFGEFINTGIADWLLNNNININQQSKATGKYPITLSLAYPNNHTRTNRLLSLGADVNIPNLDGDNALTYAIRNRDTQTVIMILTNGKNIDVDYALPKKENNTLLHVAILHQKYDVAKELIKFGANVNALNWEGNTPLHMGVTRGNVDMCEFLVKSGADFYVQNNEGVTAYGLAEAKKFNDIVKVFDDNFVTKGVQMD